MLHMLGDLYASGERAGSASMPTQDADIDERVSINADHAGEDDEATASMQRRNRKEKGKEIGQSGKKDLEEAAKGYKAPKEEDAADISAPMDTNEEGQDDDVQMDLDEVEEPEKIETHEFVPDYYDGSEMSDVPAEEYTEIPSLATSPTIRARRQTCGRSAGSPRIRFQDEGRIFTGQEA